MLLTNLNSASKRFQHLVLSFTKLFLKQLYTCEVDLTYLKVPKHSLGPYFKSHLMLMRFIHVQLFKLDFLTLDVHSKSYL